MALERSGGGGEILGRGRFGALQRPGAMPIDPRARQRAATVGWLGIGLGLTQLLAPQVLGRTFGFGGPRARTALQVLGVVEIAAGVGILSRKDDAVRLWGRVTRASTDPDRRTLRQAVHATHSITVAKPLDEVRRAWELLPVAAPLRDQGNVDIHAAPGGLGTEICLELFEDPPSAARKMIGNIFSRGPGTGVDADLRRFKQVLEVGEVVQSDASLHARPHAARPSRDAISRYDGRRSEGGVVAR